MSHVTDAIHNHHQELLARLGDGVTSLLAQGGAADTEALIDFLKGDLMPHAIGEERYMYPAVDPLLRQHGQPTATMRIDHEFIAGYVQEIEDAAQALRAAGPSSPERGTLVGRLQRLALQLDAVLRLHLEKEERVYLPLFEEYLTDEERQRVLDGMHEPQD